MKPYAIPSGLWLASALGLVIMLVGDDAWDVLGFVCLATPVFAMVRAAWRGQPR
jgi:hypothetical protein